jgi:hypothetical protein
MLRYFSWHHCKQVCARNSLLLDLPVYVRIGRGTALPEIENSLQEALVYHKMKLNGCLGMTDS